MVFNWSPRRAFVLHPPQEPLVHNLLTRSADEGASWSAPVVVPDYGWSGVECAGLTDLGGGRLMLNQWRFRWHPLPTARRHPNRAALAFPSDLAAGLLDSSELDSGSAVAADPERLMPWARDLGATYVHLSPDGGRTWPEGALPDVQPFAGGYGMRGGVVLGDGTVLLPLCDAPRYAPVFVPRSDDSGHTWSAPVTAAAVDGRLFEEPAPLLLPSGRVLLLLRENRSRSLWSTRSDDGGLSWSPPEPTGIGGYPAHLCPLPDGRILCTYAVRHGPRAILAVTSRDEGRSWDAADAARRPRRPAGQGPGLSLHPAAVRRRDAQRLLRA